MARCVTCCLSCCCGCLCETIKVVVPADFILVNKIDPFDGKYNITNKQFEVCLTFAGYNSKAGVCLFTNPNANSGATCYEEDPRNFLVIGGDTATTGELILGDLNVTSGPPGDHTGACVNMAFAYIPPGGGVLNDGVLEMSCCPRLNVCHPDVDYSGPHVTPACHDGVDYSACPECDPESEFYDPGPQCEDQYEPCCVIQLDTIGGPWNPETETAPAVIDKTQCASIACADDCECVPPEAADCLREDQETIGCNMDPDPIIPEGINPGGHPEEEEFMMMMGSEMSADAEAPKVNSPSMLRRVATFVKAATRHVAGGMRHATPELIEQRKTICAGNGADVPRCEFFKPNKTFGTCGKCACNLKMKTAWQLEVCPIGKW